MTRPMWWSLAVFACFAAALLAAPVLAQEAAKKPPITGKYRGDITDPADNKVIMRVAMQVPDKLPAEKHLGLLILFHGFQGNEGNYIGLSVDGLKRLNLLDQYVVIAGKSQGEGWTKDDDDRVIRLAKWAVNTYPIDQRRIFIFGSSNGAAFVGRFGSAHPEFLAGVIGYCGSYQFSPQLRADRPAETRTEWYFVHGGKDNPQNSRKAETQLVSLGYRAIFRQMDGYGHTDIWDSGGHPDAKAANAVRDDWMTWMHALRHKTIPPSPDEQKSLATLQERLRTNKTDDLGPLLAEAARIGGEPAGRVIVQALASKDAEVRAAAARTTQTTIYGRDVVAVLLRLLGDPSPDVKKAAIQGLGNAATWRYGEAQLTLCKMARTPTLAAADRAAAAEAVGRAAKLEFLGNFEDGLLVWTLVALLDDKEQQLRETAFAALEKQVPDTFGYKPDMLPADRKPALEKWYAWCQQKCGPYPLPN